ncbi:MAG: ABC transporter ATP-binding protein [Eubacteriales bacterium]|nr:ABC transporter ATP-binding protein [Clostridiales bacterium]MDY5835803.1 ABC transporter ATP-binding protein [Eubacteriales bacterium]
MFKKALPYARPYRLPAILSPLFMIMEVLADILIPLYMAKIVNIGIANQDASFVIQQGCIMIGLALFGAGTGIASSFCGAKAGYGIAYEMRKASYRSIQNYSFNNLDQMSVASLITRLTSDAETVGTVAMMSLRMAIRSPFMLIFALIAAIRINRELALIFAVVIPAIALIILLMFKRAMPLFQKLRKSLDTLNATIQEQLAGIDVIKAFNRQDHAYQQFTDSNNALKAASLEAIMFMVALMPLMVLIINACLIAVLWLGGLKVAEGSLPTGDLIAFITYNTQIMMSLMMLANYIINLTFAKASFDRLQEAIETEPDMEDPADPITTVADGSLSFEGVSFKYPGYKDDILADINLDLAAGQSLGIIGPTGSSKSTLVQLIPRLYDVGQGRILVGGQDVRKYRKKDLRAAIGMVLQKNTLVSGTIRSNMVWGKRDASDDQIIAALKQAQAWEFVSQYEDGLDHKVEQGGSNFSGGQKQRLTIARALLTNPKILILDDSTSAVDMDTDAKLQRAFKEGLDQVTLIMIAQRISSVKNLDKILVLDQGRIEAMGTHEELLEKSEIYKEIYRSQQRGLPA